MKPDLKEYIIIYLDGMYCVAHPYDLIEMPEHHLCEAKFKTMGEAKEYKNTVYEMHQWLTSD